MAFRNIRQWPDEILNKNSENASIEEIKSVSTDLIDTLKIIPGLGLAAPQIGILKNVIVIDVSKIGIENPDKDISNSNFWTFANPVIYGDSNILKWKEACLSVPYAHCLVSRKAFINLDYDDLNGKRKTLKLSPPLSMTVQHEADHLIGKTILDRVSSLSSKLLKKKIKKQILKNKRKQENLEEKHLSIGKSNNKNSLSLKEKKKRKNHKRENLRKK
jgi:peptide deformylase